MPLCGTTSDSYGWFVEVKDTGVNTTQTYGKAWDNDHALIGHASKPFVARGGYFGNITNAGVLSTIITYGTSISYYGFRPALAF